MHIIRILRDYMGISQKELAARAGVTAADLSEMEANKIYGRVDKYKRVADYLAVPIHTLVANDFLSVPLTFFEKNERVNYRPVSSYRNIANGREGEDFVLKKEQERVSKFNPILSKLIMPYYKMGRNLGYDILSYNEEGQCVYIEVKTTKAERKNSVLLTYNEREKAEKLFEQGEKYQVHCIDNWGRPTQTYEIFDYGELRDKSKMVPTEYMFLLNPKETISGIEYYRMKAGLDQYELADLVGINQYQVSLYENKERPYRIDLLYRMAQVFGTTIDELLKDFDSSEIFTPQIQNSEKK